jgi:two-component system NtrC family sensor kinase
VKHIGDENKAELRELIAGLQEEIAERTRGLNDLADRRDRLEKLLEQQALELEHARSRADRAERLASIGAMATGIAHEINNPIGGILLTAELAQSREGGLNEMGKALDSIVNYAKRCREITQTVRAFAQAQTSAKVPGDLNAAVRGAVALSKDHASENGCSLNLVLADDLPELVMNQTGVEQVVYNLVRNAIEADAKCATVRTSQGERGLEISVEDDGSGISDEEVSYLFERFFTTRRHRGGTGLGLSIAHTIVTDHGGAIHLESEPSCGTTVHVHFPIGIDASKE